MVGSQFETVFVQTKMLVVSVKDLAVLRVPVVNVSYVVLAEAVEGVDINDDSTGDLDWNLIMLVIPSNRSSRIPGVMSICCFLSHELLTHAL